MNSKFYKNGNHLKALHDCARLKNIKWALSSPIENEWIKSILICIAYRANAKGKLIDINEQSVLSFEESLLDFNSVFADDLLNEAQTAINYLIENKFILKKQIQDFTIYNLNQRDSL